MYFIQTFFMTLSSLVSKTDSFYLYHIIPSIIPPADYPTHTLFYVFNHARKSFNYHLNDFEYKGAEYICLASRYEY